jgi:hypothetical protein
MTPFLIPSASRTLSLAATAVDALTSASRTAAIPNLRVRSFMVWTPPCCISTFAGV